MSMSEAKNMVFYACKCVTLNLPDICVTVGLCAI